MKNIGTKSVNMSDIMVYLAIFSTLIDQILFGPFPKFPRYLVWKASLRVSINICLKVLNCICISGHHQKQNWHLKCPYYTFRE